MSDFRQAAIDAILEDLAFDSVKELRAYVSKNKQDDYFYGGVLHAINAVQDLPSAQPEIIRCKDCKHRNKDGECGQYDDGTVAVSCEVPDDHYCGYAERRTE